MPLLSVQALQQGDRQSRIVPGTLSPACLYRSRSLSNVWRMLSTKCARFRTLPRPVHISARKLSSNLCLMFPT